jgi:hypothetical protein
MSFVRAIIFCGVALTSTVSANNDLLAPEIRTEINADIKNAVIKEAAANGRYAGVLASILPHCGLTHGISVEKLEKLIETKDRTYAKGSDARRAYVNGKDEAEREFANYRPSRSECLDAAHEAQ